MDKVTLVIHEAVPAEIEQIEASGQAGQIASGEMLAVMAQLEKYGRRHRPVQELQVYKQLLGLSVYIYIDNIYEMYYCELPDGVIFVLHCTSGSSVKERDKAEALVSERLSLALQSDD